MKYYRYQYTRTFHPTGEKLIQAGWFRNREVFEFRLAFWSRVFPDRYDYCETEQDRLFNDTKEPQLLESWDDNPFELAWHGLDYPGYEVVKKTL
jgi:hypothetical protein